MPINRILEEDQLTTEVVAQVLVQAGITHVVGVSGGHTGRIFSALEKFQDSIRTMLVREESLGAVMAEVHGRLTRRPGVLIGQGPWILGNGMIGTIEAFLSSSPMLLLSDFSDSPPFSLHGPYQSGTGDYGNWDARQAFKGVTKQVFEARDPNEAPHAVQLAIKHCLTGRPGPVAVLFHGQALTGNVSHNSRLRLYPTQYYLPVAPAPVAGAQIRRAVQTLLAAKRPVLIAGNGVRIGHAYDALERCARRFSLPVATTSSGKGVFADTDPLGMGVFGTFGTGTANAAIADADVILVVGSKMTASDTAFENPLLIDPERQTIIQIDIEPLNAGWTFPVEYVLVGEVGAVLDQMIEAAGDQAPIRDGAAYVSGLRKQHGYFSSPRFDSEEKPIRPERVIADLFRTLPSDAIVCTDAGENRLFATHYYRVPKAGGFLPSAGAGPMGYGIPAAMSAKVVHPDRPAVAIVGDGGFSMTMNGLISAIELDLPIIVVVFNNSALGWSMHMRGPFAAKFGDFDYAAMARSMGCEGIRVEEPADLVPAIRTALGSRRPTVIDVITSLDSSFTEVLSPLGEGLGFPKTQKAKELNEDLERFKAQDARLQTRP